MLLMVARKGHKAVARLRVEMERKAVVRLLLKNGFDIAAQDFDRANALDWC
jgi:hypothetical protein